MTNAKMPELPRYTIVPRKYLSPEAKPTDLAEITLLSDAIAHGQACWDAARVVDEGMRERALKAAEIASDQRLARYSVIDAILQAALGGDGDV